MISPVRSYVIGCTPRCGSHLLADGLDSTGIAGHPAEQFPRLTSGTKLQTAADRDEAVMRPPPESSYDALLDAEYVARIIEAGTTANGVFGITIHWLQMNDAVRRIRAYCGVNDTPAHETLSSAFPNVSYIWLRRRDKIAQAVSWYKAILTGRYVKLRGYRDPSDANSENLQFDYAMIESYLSALTCFENSWTHFFSSNRLIPFVLYYEDLATNYVGSVRAVVNYLGLGDADFQVRAPRHERAADAHSLGWIEKFRAMQGTARGRTGFR